MRRSGVLEEMLFGEGERVGTAGRTVALLRLQSK